MQRRRRTSAGPELDRLIELLAKLPGLGPRSATRAALHLLKNKDRHLAPLTQAMGQALEKVVACSLCGNLDTSDPCGICTDETRDGSLLCVVADVGDLWALERSGGIAGRYHVLGGLLSALDGVRPQDLRIGSLVEKVRASMGKDGAVKEVVLPCHRQSMVTALRTISPICWARPASPSPDRPRVCRSAVILSSWMT